MVQSYWEQFKLHDRKYDYKNETIDHRAAHSDNSGRRVYSPGDSICRYICLCSTLLSCYTDRQLSTFIKAQTCTVRLKLHWFDLLSICPGRSFPYCEPFHVRYFTAYLWRVAQSLCICRASCHNKHHHSRL